MELLTYDDIRRHRAGAVANQALYSPQDRQTAFMHATY